MWKWIGSNPFFFSFLYPTSFSFCFPAFCRFYRLTSLQSFTIFSHLELWNVCASRVAKTIHSSSAMSPGCMIRIERRLGSGNDWTGRRKRETAGSLFSIVMLLVMYWMENGCHFAGNKDSRDERDQILPRYFFIATFHTVFSRIQMKRRKSRRN